MIVSDKLLLEDVVIQITVNSLSEYISWFQIRKNEKINEIFPSIFST